jgi:hypothetical protein
MQSLAGTMVTTWRQLAADAIYGANDGLGAYSTVLGVARQVTAALHFIAGLAERLASTLPMAARYLAAKSEAEVRSGNLARARRWRNPCEEIEEMRLSTRDSARKNRRKWQNVSPSSPNNSHRRWRSELGLSEHRFPNQ